MAAYDNAHSRIVAWLKILLPLAALAIMSTVFLVAQTIDPAQDLPFANVDVAELAREQRIGGPTFSGVTSDGAALTISAAAVRPNLGDTDTASASEIDAEVLLPIGTTVTLHALDGVIDAATKTAELGGGVKITTSTGYRIQTDRLAALLDSTRLESGGAITADGPLGSISAGRMLISRDAQSSAYLLVFKDGVKLIYTPDN
ncbi:MAG: hypothetical protein ACRBBK_04690 [Paracoccaceae bacterium]